MWYDTAILASCLHSYIHIFFIPAAIQVVWYNIFYYWYVISVAAGIEASNTTDNHLPALCCHIISKIILGCTHYWTVWIMYTVYSHGEIYRKCIQGYSNTLSTISQYSQTFKSTWNFCNNTGLPINRPI